MKIYIASSWRHKSAIQMITELLRDNGHEVLSWIENCDKEGEPHFNFEDWVLTPEADKCFKYDIDGATKSDLVIYYGAAGKDACIEIGAAYGAGVPVLALWGKGEDMGLMRKIVARWFTDYKDLLQQVEVLQITIESVY